jgi:hypothetical protein
VRKTFKSKTPPDNLFLSPDPQTPLRESGNNRKAFSHVLYLSLSFVVVVVVVVVIKVELFIKGLKVLIRGDFSLNSMEKELELNFF